MTIQTWFHCMLPGYVTGRARHWSPVSRFSELKHMKTESSISQLWRLNETVCGNHTGLPQPISTIQPGTDYVGVCYKIADITVTYFLPYKRKDKEDNGSRKGTEQLRVISFKLLSSTQHHTQVKSKIFFAFILWII